MKKKTCLAEICASKKGVEMKGEGKGEWGGVEEQQGTERRGELLDPLPSLIGLSLEIFNFN